MTESAESEQPAGERRAEVAPDRAELLRAEQLVEQAADLIRGGVGPECFEAEAAPNLKTVRDRIRREIALLPPPS